MIAARSRGSVSRSPTASAPPAGETPDLPPSARDGGARRAGSRFPPEDACDNRVVREFVESLVASGSFEGQIVHRRAIPPAPARYRELETPLSPELRAAAARLGVERLYAHQAEAIDLIRRGRDVAVVTPTASGKSLVNYLPTAEMIARQGGHALYLFPYKALAQDQGKKLEVFGRGLMGLRNLTVDIYDGDTPQARRRRIRAEPPDILITNPDMLHLGLLAYHGEWARFFGALRLVVIDELHVYRGIFGSHFAHVMRRLSRVCAHYGAEPRYLVGSATIGNPAAFTESLLGRRFAVVSESGSPRSGRHFLFVNPVGSPYTAATRLFTCAIRAGLRTIAFTKARRITELMHSWAIEQAGVDLAGRIASYRAGYLPEERRVIERKLFRGELMGVIATSALELGIDVGGLDVCILVGYPGSVMSAWQRVGRVGRQERDSLVVLVAQPDALDQYFMAHPEEFFERGFEPAVVDPSNSAVAGAHIVCAGAELPVSRDEAEAYVGADALAALVAEGRLAQDETGERYFSFKRRPHQEVNLRSGGESFAILADDGERPIGTIDGVRVFHECHEGAIYLHGGNSYRIVRLDQEAKRVLAVPFAGDYYTQALGNKETEILATYRESERPGYRLSLGRLKVTLRITEYARKRLRDQQTISKHPLDVPPIVFETIGFWMTLPLALEAEAVRRELHFMGGLHGSEHAMISLFPLLALCDRSDIGGISYSRNPQLGAPAIFIYDGHPGGIGLAASVHDRIEDLFRATRRLLTECLCEEGCPSCVQSPKCGSGNRPLDKQAARLVMAHLAGDPLPSRRAPDVGDLVAMEEAGRERPLVAVHDAERARAKGGEVRLDPKASLIGRREDGADSSRPERGDGAAPQPPAGRPDGGGGPWGREAPAPRDPAGRAGTEVRLPPGEARDEARGQGSGPAPSPGAAPPTAPAAPPAAPAVTTGGARTCRFASGPFPLREDEGRVLVLDVETRRSAEEVGGWGHIPAMGLALAVVYDVRRNEATTYFEENVERLVLELVMADMVIGYNSERFDLPVLSAYGSWNLSRIRSFDMLAYIRSKLGFRLKLGDLAEANLGIGKSADGLQSLKWFKEGRLDLIEEYCRMDVEVTTRLFFLGRERGYLLFKGRDGVNLRLPVSW
jgi:DEAD/DEAH box helicase domain-containing protein